MNIFILTEGEIGERYVYEKWVTYENPQLTFVPHLFEISENNFSILSGQGYPQYFDMIENAIADVNSHGKIDRFIIAIDSEEMTEANKEVEVSAFLNGRHCKAEIHIVVQHYCLETWGLANRKIFTQNPKDSDLNRYVKFYNVKNDDPALMPAMPGSNLNRSQFSSKYLRRLLNEKHRNLTYNKNNPEALLHKKYFQEVRERHKKTGHIASFARFLTAVS